MAFRLLSLSKLVNKLPIFLWFKTPWRPYAHVMDWKMAVISQMTILDAAYLLEHILYLDYNFTEGSIESKSALPDQIFLQI